MRAMIHLMETCCLILLLLFSTNCYDSGGVHQNHSQEEAVQKWNEERMWDSLFQREEQEERKERRAENRH